MNLSRKNQQPKEEATKVFKYRKEINGNLKNTFQGYQTIYIDEYGLPFHSKIHIDKLVLNSDSKVEYDNSLSFLEILNEKRTKGISR